ncbi:hypothetical protein Btru_068148 [Bulinus truncatus]|nr:hypothetical protein Btru_068148 [Bulinus truncatus]
MDHDNVFNTYCNDFSNLRLDGDSKLQNLAKLVQFLSNKPQVLVTRYEVYVSIAQDTGINSSVISQYNCYIIKEGEMEPNDAPLEKNKKDIMTKSSACQTGPDNILVENRFQLNSDGLRSGLETVVTKKEVIDYDGPLNEFGRLGETRIVSEKRNSEVVKGISNSSSTYRTHLSTSGIESDSPLEVIASIQNLIEIDVKPEIVSDISLDMDVSAVRDTSSVVYESLKENGEPFKCLECGLIFQKAESLWVHEISHSNSVKQSLLYKCPLCDYSCKNKRNILDHAEKNHNVKFHLCVWCRFVAMSQEQLADHESQWNDGTKCFVTKKLRVEKGLCPQCGYVAPDARDLRRHLLGHTDLRSYSCPHCPLRFKSEKNLLIHADTHCSFKSFKCSHCSYSTHSNHFLTRHIQKSHLDVGRYKCKDCESSFKNMYHLKEHAQNQHGSEDHFFCGFCTFSCSNRKIYKCHIQTHTGKDRYSCDKCDYTCYVKSQMLKHQVIHSDVLPFVCCQCGRQFRDKGNLTKHMSCHQEERNFQCEMCGFRTKSKKLLKEHQIMHRKSKMHRCLLCEYITRYPGNLRKHEGTHSEIKSYFCDLCPYASNIAEGLKKHRKRKHKLVK